MLKRLVTCLHIEHHPHVCADSSATEWFARHPPPGSKLEQLFTGGVLTEGPAAAPDGTIYFSDITFTEISGMQAGHIMRFDPKTGKTWCFALPAACPTESSSMLRDGWWWPRARTTGDAA